MKVVIVGGHARKVGKTAVVEGLLRGLNSLRWTAIKISPHAPPASPPNRRGGSRLAARRGFSLVEERDARGRGDSSRYLAAGAKRALWLRVCRGRMAEAMPALRRALRNERCVIIESNEILTFVRPQIFLMVLDSRKSDFKSSARAVLKHADAIITVDFPPTGRVWPGVDARMLARKPCFPVSRQDYFSLELCRFVRQRLARPCAPGSAPDASQLHQRKEPTWRRSAMWKSKTG